MNDRHFVIRGRPRSCTATRIANPSFFNTGFRFVNLPGEDGFLLEDIMHKFNLVG
jgi:hypothetical protein